MDTLQATFPMGWLQEQSLSVVPIFVNAGTAILPAILAPVASAAALLLRPKELVRVMRRNPAVLLGALLSGIGIWMFVSWLTSASAKPAARAEAAPSAAGVNWADVARDILKRNGGLPVTRPAGNGGDVAARHSGPIVFGNSYARTGHDGSLAPLGLKPVWEKPEEGAWFLSSPAVSQGRVFAATALADVAGKFGALMCLDAATGKEIWRQEKYAGEDLKPFFSSPALTADGKCLLIGQGLHDDKDSSLLCVDANTGKLKWRVKTTLHIESSPAIHGDIVVAGVGSIEGPDRKPLPGTDGGFVLAVRISDGQELWRCPLPDVESSPAISPDGIVYVGSGFQGNAIVALRSEPDAELKEKKLDRLVWRFDTKVPIGGPITLHDNLVLAGGGNGDFIGSDAKPTGVVVALDAKTGRKRWETPFPDAVLTSIAAIDGKAVCGCRTGEVVTMNLSDGKVIWRRAISGSAPVLASPAVTKRHVYAVTNDGTLAVLNLSDGSIVERITINADGKPAGSNLCLSSPTIAASMLYVGSESGGLRCFGGEKLAE
jgi:outer membrane protein assembly factor BamB